jgi:glycosyltransferase involved in cell wall biosynthesis
MRMSTGLPVAICIATHNRLPELERTLPAIRALDPAPDEVIVTADGCSDGTVDWILKNYPEVVLIVHETAKGSIVSRTKMGLQTKCAIFFEFGRR